MPPAQPDRVAVVDDDEPKRYVIAHALRTAGFEVAEGADADDALRLAPGAAVLVLDVRMPGASGFDVCRRLKADPSTASLPVLLLSATFVDPDSQVRGLESGADAYLTDATEPPVLVATVRALLRVRRAQDELRRARDELEARVRERTAELGATLVALEAEVARRADLARRLASAHEDERRRLSRDLHDTAGQTLAALVLMLDVARDAGPLPPAAAERLDRAREAAEALRDELHDIAVRLRPALLEDMGLGAAARALCKGWARRRGAAVEFQEVGPGGGRLPAEVETALYRVVQEALTNVARHAGATRVSVTVGQRGGEAVAVVEDDGAGFDPGPAGGDRLGLVGMRERVALVGGELDVESTPGGGTTVIARAPLPDQPGPG